MTRKCMSDRVLSPKIEHSCGSIKGENEGDPGRVPALPGSNPDHPTKPEAEADVTITAVRSGRDGNVAILDALSEVDDIHALAKSARLRLIRVARSMGATNQQVADAIGMTEAGVRQILIRDA